MDETRALRVQRAARIAVLVTLGLAAIKVAVWAATSSLAVLSQALDSLLDVISLALLLVGLRIAGKPADTSHHYGHAKAENLVAFTQTLILGAVALGVAITAVSRLVNGAEQVTTPWYAFAALAVSGVVDAVRARSLLASARHEHSDALMAGALNIVIDVGTAVLAFLSLVLVRAGIQQADAVGGLVVASVVGVAAARVGKGSVDVLMDRAPQTWAQDIEAAANRTPGVTETRRVRVRGAADQLFADITVAAGRTATLERAHDIAEAVENEIKEVAPGADVVVHVEPISETSGLIERAQAAASRIDGIHEVHNVQIHAFHEAGQRKLHVTLHAKVEPGISLEEAHRLSDLIEETVEGELGDNIRVDTHIEPLKRTALGHDVTSSRSDVVEAVRALAVQETDVLDCHEIIVTSVDGELAVVAHVHGRGDIPLSRIHQASDRVEKAIQMEHPDVASVTIHFEPA